MGRPNPKPILLVVCLMLATVSGCTPTDSDGPAPAVPTNLRATRSADNRSVYSIWTGETQDYDFQGAYQDKSNGWTELKEERLRPAKVLPPQKYFRDMAAYPQPMRVRVRSVKSGQHSSWTEWVDCDAGGR